MGIVCIKASYRNAANWTEKTGIAHCLYVGSFSNWINWRMFCHRFSNYFRRIQEKSSSMWPNAQHSCTKLSYAVVIKEKFLGNKDNLSLGNLVEFRVFQRRCLLELTGSARWSVLQGELISSRSSSLCVGRPKKAVSLLLYLAKVRALKRLWLKQCTENWCLLCCSYAKESRRRKAKAVTSLVLCL